MPHRSGSFADVFFVHWQSAPIPSELAALEPEVEKAWRRAGKKVMYLVLEGQGFRASIQRSVVIGLTLWKERGFMTICGTADEAMAKIAARSSADRETLYAAARGHGLLR